MHNARDTGAARLDDPWYDTLASGWAEPDDTDSGPRRTRPPAAGETGPAEDVHTAAEVYTKVHDSAAFQEVRRRHRRFVFPAVAAFLIWYLAYVVAATTAPGLMARPVVGTLNVAMLAGLAQFATTFLLAWAYARHARLRRDRVALELRWVTQEMMRGHRR
ncbi:DUF485 domain-containing protein [Streptomyces sp. S465]|nr:DUF485 domain-containing protein [Streptomyces sp. S465]WAP60982.1 DUF485 domain-containing protein [Streptomyces sp. S465]